MMRSLVRDNRGQELVEYALTLPILLLMVLGIMEFGVAIFTYNSIANAAREGARVGAVVRIEANNVQQAVDDVKEAVIARTGGVRLSEDDIDVAPLEDTGFQSIGAGDPISITVRYRHPLITGLIMGALGGAADLELRSVATMSREAGLAPQ